MNYQILVSEQVVINITILIANNKVLVMHIFSRTFKIKLKNITHKR